VLNANVAMWVDQTKDEGVYSVIRSKQQEEGEEDGKEEGEEKGEAKVEKQETVELPRPS